MSKMPQCAPSATPIPHATIFSPSDADANTLLGTVFRSILLAVSRIRSSTSFSSK
jgi:hypothetical protein